MSSIHSAISVIDRSRDTWQIRGKVIGLFRKSFSSLEQIDMVVVVFMDVEGNTIEANIRKNMIARFSEQLILGRSYAVKLFNVIEQSGGYRYSTHPFRISFNFLTVVSPIDQINIPRSGFKFVKFEDIEANKLDSNYLVDVIGFLSYIGDLEIIEGRGIPARVSHKINFELKSISDTIIKCTVWDNYAHQLKNYCDESTKSDIVVIVQFAKMKDFCGQTFINNAYSGTTLVLDQSVAEIVEFKQRAEVAGSASPPISHGRRITSISKFEDAVAKTVTEIVNTTEPSSCVTVATIKAIENKETWFYTGCKRCNTRLEAQEGNFWCRKCKSALAFPKQCYLLYVRVEDGTGSSVFAMFDVEVIQMVKKSVTDLLEGVAEDCRGVFPTELNGILGKKCVFLVQVTEANLKNPGFTFSVRKLSCDEACINQFEITHQEVEVGLTSECSTNDISTSESYNLVTPSKRRRFVIDLDSSDDDIVENDPSKNSNVVVKLEKDADKGNV